MFLRIFKHLLPNARAWRITVDKTLRQFFEGLTGVGEDSRVFFDGIYEDLDPQRTRELAQWESQFALLSTGLTQQGRRDRLAATWAALGGQDPRYIQDTLQAAGFDVYVHEWWVPGSAPPTLREPLDFLFDGSGAAIEFLMADGTADSQDGDAISQDGGSAIPSGYPLVNKILEPNVDSLGDGSLAMQDGGTAAQDGAEVIIYRQKQYIIPLDPTKWPFFFYIGGQTFPDQATVLESRRDEFEDLCLKICPMEQWLGILVNYS